MVASKEDKSLLPTKVDLIEEVSSEVVIELMKEGLERLKAQRDEEGNTNSNIKYTGKRKKWED